MFNHSGLWMAQICSNSGNESTLTPRTRRWKMIENCRRVCPRSHRRLLLEFLDVEFAEAFGGWVRMPATRKQFRGLIYGCHVYVCAPTRVHSPQEKPGVEKATRKREREREWVRRGWEAKRHREKARGNETPVSQTETYSSCFAFLPVLLLSPLSYRVWNFRSARVSWY